MLTIYLVMMLTGGVLVLGSALTGIGEDTDFNVQGETGIELDCGLQATDVGTNPDALSMDIQESDGMVGDAPFVMSSGDGLGELLGSWLPILSLRFWTFFSAFFGAAGTAISILGGFNGLQTAVTAVAIGYISGLVATKVISKLQRQTVDSRLSKYDYLGQSGKVLVPIGHGSKGKVRLHIRGRALDCLADSVSGDVLDAGVSIRVIDTHQDGSLTVSKIPNIELA